MQGRAWQRAPLPLLLAAAVLVALPGSAVAGWDGMQNIGLGDKISAEFGASDTSVHEFHFYAPEGTTVDVKAKADSGLTLDFELWSDLGVQVDLTGASEKGFKKIAIPADGTYILSVMADAGSGMYSLTTKGKFPKGVTVEDDDDEVHFGAVAGSMVQAQVKSAKGSSASAVIDGLEYPGGMVTITAGSKVKVATALPVSNTYFFTLDITGTGDVVTQVKVKAPKSKRSWGFGVAEAPHGVPSTIRDKWLGSPHADYSAEAFRHWDEDGEVSESCAKCHSSYGYQDWVGADGSDFESIEMAAALGTTVDCDACHNSGTEGLSTVLFPSGLRIDDLGNEARCMQCHQGRESGVSMDEMFDERGGDDDNAVPDNLTRNSDGSYVPGSDGKGDLSFLNVHYLAAGATLYGRQSHGGYEYAGEDEDNPNYYNGRFYHVKEKDTCIECHDPHTTVLRLNDCLVCHPEATDYDGLKDIRMTRTLYDYDGDANTTEGVAMEIEGMANALYAAMRAYSAQVSFGSAAAGTNTLGWSSGYPYYYRDTNGNDVKDPGEGTYATWTPNLLRAAYNYQYWKKDPGAFAHNARYTMELLYDSYMSLQGSGVYKALSTVLVRNEMGGHFDATSEAYRHWDEDEEVSTSCAQCHSPDGFEFYVNYTTSSVEQNPFISPALPEGMRCESCHVDGADFAGSPALREPAAVWFPSGEILKAGTTPDRSFLCMTCHQGRESKSSVDTMIGLSGLGDDVPATGTVGRGKAGEPNKLSFKNVHYLPAGATLYGTDAMGAYEYDGAPEYNGQWTHKNEAAFGPTNGFQCNFCHLSDHTFEPKADTTCSGCHGSTNLETYNLNRYTANGGYDGNISTTTLHEEVLGFETRLLNAIYAYSYGGGRVPIVYDGSSHPYWFVDANKDLVPDVDGDGDKIAYTTFTPRLNRACYNYQYSHKEPGAWAHNTIYVLQVLYDSIVDLEVAIGGTTYSNLLYVDDNRDSRP